MRNKLNQFTPAEIDQIIVKSKLSAEWLQANYNEARAAAYRLRPRSVARRHSRYAPPKVTRGETQLDTQVIHEGNLTYETGRRGWGGDTAFCDWLNFTCSVETFDWNSDSNNPCTPEQRILEISYQMMYCFGFGITAERAGGAYFYKRSWSLGDGVGMVCMGGQQDTVLISMSGSALSAARPGWEGRIHDFLAYQAVRPNISRVDVAHDDMKGAAYSVDQAVTDWDRGYFKALAGGRNPDIEQRGNWKSPNGKGRTVYIGNRKNGKYARIYEKGRQLGDKESDWVRIEVEFKSVDRVVPFDILLNAGEYLAAAYPAFSFIKDKQSRIATKKKEVEKTYAKTIAWLKRQCGPAIGCVVEIEGSYEAAFLKIHREGVPKVFDVPAIDTMTMPFHLRPSLLATNEEETQND
jgi:phage replication initiation protein